MHKHDPRKTYSCYYCGKTEDASKCAHGLPTTPAGWGLLVAEDTDNIIGAICDECIIKGLNRDDT